MHLKYKFIAVFFSQKEKNECHYVLMATNTYYKNLSENNRGIFRIRTLLFLRTTGFNSEVGFLLKNNMKILISSAFVQITFGLNMMTLRTFNSIFVTPRSYSYLNNKAIFDGDVNLYTKKVNMSWPAIERGFDIPDDAMNLAIHEFGHCIFFENATRSFLFKIFKGRDFEVWKKEAVDALKRVQLRELKVLRDYAGTNSIELFSVSLETFFEKPVYFERKEPNLYWSMAHLLKQDPRNTSDPILK
ncbi:MAG: zinc-dependent peptidase [Flavobacteriaceae bacterium]|nr:zinc-dependent peptidase [Flavobacteriaceae bacterium]